MSEIRLTPSRLLLARHRRRLTLRELSDRVGCTPAAISQFEDGKRNPSDDTVRRLALALSFPVAFLTADEVEPLEVESTARSNTSSVASFRSLRSLTSRDRHAALAVGVFAVQLADAVASRVTTPALSIPDLQGETPEHAAAILRGMWERGDGPIGNMVHLLEARGVRVTWMRRESHAVDAFSFWRDGRPYVVLGTHKTAERSRRDAAHELAHLVLHRHGDVCGREAEDEAERFASAFLVPSEQFLKECPVDPSREALSELKRRWMVSRVSLVRRAYELGLMTEWQYRSECIAISTAGREKEQDPIDREESLLFSKVLLMFAGAGITLDDVAAELHLPSDDLLDIVPVESPERWLTASPAGRVLEWAPRAVVAK
jgi:Zn-dependent peptidase ImmA (M78 family)/transcriptional regulator with XRE-family HTH domain